MEPSIVQSFFLIFTGAAVLASLALYSRQPLLVAYIAIGCLLGPHGFKLVTDADLLAEIAEFGIIFLLFLVGLDLQPAKLKNMVGESLMTALVTSLVFFSLGFAVMFGFGFTLAEALVTGIAVTFSSTLIGIKLLPTTVLHHRHIGEIVISLLLVQDIIAILALMVLARYGGSADEVLTNLAVIVVATPVLIGGAFIAVRWLVLPLITRFDAFHEFIFLLAIGWCLGLASAGHAAGLSLEIGAFIAGTSLATSPIAQYIAESLRPLRDFFLILFFFSVGAGLDIMVLAEVLVPTVLLAVAIVALKPVMFAQTLRMQGEQTGTSWEVGFRLGQASEFSLLLSYLALSVALISKESAHIIQGATVLTLLLSSYLVVFRYPSPIAVSEKLRRD